MDYQKYLTPINFSEENGLFLKNYREKKVYNPQYKYYKFCAENIYDTFHILENLVLDNCKDNNIFRESIDKLDCELKMYENIGDDEKFSESSIYVYGEPDIVYESEAKKDICSIAHSSSESIGKYTPKELEYIIMKRLKEYGFDWKINVTSNMTSRISVEPDSKEIFINSHKKFSHNDILRLLVHEIDTHVLRTENGFLRKYAFYSADLSRTIMHEEGLALYNEKINGLQDDFAQLLYCARFLCCVNYNMSFYELFDMLINYGCSEDISLYIVSRIKRGLSDTSKPGGFVKDYVYYQGLKEIETAIEKDKGIYNKMYYGNISLKDIDTLGDNIDKAVRDNSIIMPIDAEASV